MQHRHHIQWHYKCAQNHPNNLLIPAKERLDSPILLRK